MIGFNLFLGDWQRHVQGQVSTILKAIFDPDANPVSIRFVRHSPGRRRSSDLTMYDVCCATPESSELVRSSFAKYRRRDSPVPRPASLQDINIFPLVR